jgi:hypothetical protein
MDRLMIIPKEVLVYIVHIINNIEFVLSLKTLSTYFDSMLKKLYGIIKYISKMKNNWYFITSWLV